MTRRRKMFVYGAILVAFNLALLYGAFRAYVWWSTRELFKISRTAWEACYTEYGQPVPARGPREGYWGTRLRSPQRPPGIGWMHSEQHLDDRINFDKNGMQHAGKCSNCPKLLIVGASTASGAYASTFAKTYFVRMAEELERLGQPARISVLAAGAWKSVQELEALRVYGLPTKPDAVLFLNGLNDLTNGSNARTLFGVKTKTKDGSRWQALYHEHDYEERVQLYISNMREMSSLLRANDVRVIFALQPVSFEKKTLSKTEQWLEDWSLKPHRSKQALLDSYEEIRKGLMAMASLPGFTFIDCRKAFENEPGTIFTDFWHFADRGHDRLGTFLARELAPIVADLKEKKDRL